MSPFVLAGVGVWSALALVRARVSPLRRTVLPLALAAALPAALGILEWSPWLSSTEWIPSPGWVSASPELPSLVMLSVASDAFLTTAQGLTAAAVLFALTAAIGLSLPGAALAGGRSSAALAFALSLALAVAAVVLGSYLHDWAVGIVAVFCCGALVVARRRSSGSTESIAASWLLMWLALAGAVAAAHVASLGRSAAGLASFWMDEWLAELAKAESSRALTSWGAAIGALALLVSPGRELVSLLRALRHERTAVAAALGSVVVVGALWCVELALVSADRVPAADDIVSLPAAVLVPLARAQSPLGGELVVPLRTEDLGAVAASVGEARDMIDVTRALGHFGSVPELAELDGGCPPAGGSYIALALDFRAPMGEVERVLALLQAAGAERLPLLVRDPKYDTWTRSATYARLAQETVASVWLRGNGGWGLQRLSLATRDSLGGDTLVLTVEPDGIRAGRPRAETIRRLASGEHDLARLQLLLEESGRGELAVVADGAAYLQDVLDVVSAAQPHSTSAVALVVD